MPATGHDTEPLLLVPEIRLAHTALGQLASTSPTRPTLAYISGPAGTGKSHLVRWFLANITGRRLGVTASQFASELAQASAERLVPQFQEKYRELDVLACEDMQGLEGRRESQQQLLAVLDCIISQGGCVLVTATRLPGRLTRFNRRLASRLGGGVVASVRLPGPASRLQLLEHFASREQVPLPADAARLLAQQLKVSPRELRAVVGQLDTLARISGGSIDERLARHVIASDIEAKPPTVARVGRAVARHFGISLRLLRKRSRAHQVVLPRQCGMFLARELTGAIYSQIADYFGCNNHTTVLHACRRMRERLPEDAELRLAVHAIHAELSGREEPGRG